MYLYLYQLQSPGNFSWLQHAKSGIEPGSHWRQVLSPLCHPCSLNPLTPLPSPLTSKILWRRQSQSKVLSLTGLAIKGLKNLLTLIAKFRDEAFSMVVCLMICHHCVQDECLECELSVIIMLNYVLMCVLSTVQLNCCFFCLCRCQRLHSCGRLSSWPCGSTEEIG